MCSVVGYIGQGLSCEHVMEGLSRLEYRGYDSAGFACLDNATIYAHKAQGKLQELKNKLDQAPIDGHVGIGHTRWATHGGATERNAHPHFDCKKRIALAHNGIIENHHELRERLQKTGHHFFHSDTDSEIIAHILEEALAQEGSLAERIGNAARQLDGAFAFVALLHDYPDILCLARKRSPLCVGIGEGCMFVASDVLAFAGKTDQVVYLPDETYALVTASSLALYDMHGKPLTYTVQKVDVTWDVRDKQGYAHYMLKEIYEQKSAIYSTINALQSNRDAIMHELKLSHEYMRDLESINLIGCGTSWHAGRIAQFFFEEICMLPTQVHLASEFRYKQFFPQKNSMYIAISQSGETADTLESIRFINAMKMPTIVLTNVASSTMVRECTGFFLTHAGREIAVASTKAFSTQITALYWLAHLIVHTKGMLTSAHLEKMHADVMIAAEILESSLENYKYAIQNSIVPKYAHYDRVFFIGRYMSYPFALEAALKLKEIAYIFGDTYPAGELKHGPLALIDQNVPVFVFSYQNETIYQKLLSNVQEVKARGGRILSFAFEGQDRLIELSDDVFIIPRLNPRLGPLAMTGLMQYLCYAIANELNCPIDQPRNLAKSVTVE